MASTTSHQDASRSGVGVTAHGVAYMRSLETAKGPEKALIQDPYAQHLVIIPEDTLKELFRSCENAASAWGRNAKMNMFCGWPSC